MIENERFNIKPSSIIDDCFVIIDSESKYSFSTLESTLNHMFCKALNELNDENKQLKEENECLKQYLKHLEYRFTEYRNKRGGLNVTEKQYCYILEKYPFYEGSEILMVSASCDEITTHFIKESRKLNDGYGLTVRKYEFGKLYDNIINRANSIRWIEKEDGKIRDLKQS